jgi:hypothetical protein
MPEHDFQSLSRPISFCQRAQRSPPIARTFARHGLLRSQYDQKDFGLANFGRSYDGMVASWHWRRGASGFARETASHGKEVQRILISEPQFDMVDIRDIPDDELDDLFGGRSIVPTVKAI